MSNGILVFIEHKGGVAEQDFARGDCCGAESWSRLQKRVRGRSGFEQAAGAGDCRVRSRKSCSRDEREAGRLHAGRLTRCDGAGRQADWIRSFVIMSHTYLVRDFAPKLAARFGKSLISDCIRAQGRRTDTITFTRRIFLGKLDADVVSDGEPPVFATFQSGAYRADQAAKGSGAPVENNAGRNRRNSHEARSAVSRK